MTTATYKNYYHYIKEGWSNQPKETFISIANLIKDSNLPNESHCLDVGCATGELINFLSAQFPSYSFFGIDIFDDLINMAKKLQPQHTFKNNSVLSLPETMKEQFDIVIVMGVMSIFDENELELFWNKVFSATKSGGKIIVFSPLNEFGVDAIIRHRKRINGVLKDWEAGWNIYSTETIKEILSLKKCIFSMKPFKINIDLYPKDDPIRTWTINTAANFHQLTNGLKLLVDHYFIEVTKQ